MPILPFYVLSLELLGKIVEEVEMVFVQLYNVSVSKREEEAVVAVVVIFHHRLMMSRLVVASFTPFGVAGTLPRGAAGNTAQPLFASVLAAVFSLPLSIVEFHRVGAAATGRRPL